MIKILEKYNFWGKLKKQPGLYRSNYVEALLEQKKTKNIVSAILGVRRSGKSTICKQVLYKLINQERVRPEQTLFVNFEDSAFVPYLKEGIIYEIIELYEKEIAKRGRKYIVFDEVQSVQGWEREIRTLVDNRDDLKVYITGSSAKLLGQELGTKLSGRYISNEVFPLTWEEYKKFQKRKSEVIFEKNYLHDGGFPGIVLEDNLELKKQLLVNYFDSILLRDISERYNIRNITKLRNLVQYLMTNNSNLASTVKFKKLLGLDIETILNYFDYIENAYLGFFIPKFSYSLKQQIYNPQKFYAIDIGLQKSIAFEIIDNHGKHLENLVFLSLRRLYKDVFYWRGKQEVDFIIKKGVGIEYIINVSWSLDDEKTRLREIEGLKEAMLELEKPESLIITKDENEIIETDVGRVNVIDFEKFTKMIENRRKRI